MTCGLRDVRMKNRLLREPNLTLKKAMEICKAAEEAEQLIEDLKKPMENLRVGNIRAKHNTRPPQNVPHKSMYCLQSRTSQPTKPSRENGSVQNQMQPRQPAAAGGLRVPERQGHGRQCNYCGYTHESRRCPAYGKKCGKCFRFNHFASKCMSRTISTLYTTDNNYSTDDSANSISDNAQVENKEVETYTLGNIYINDSNVKDWINTYFISECNKKLDFKLDCGADCNVIPYHVFERLQLNEPLLKPSNCKVHNYDGTELLVKGICVLTILHNNQKVELDFVIINSQLSKPLLGMKTIQ